MTHLLAQASAVLVNQAVQVLDNYGQIHVKHSDTGSGISLGFDSELRYNHDLFRSRLTLTSLAASERRAAAKTRTPLVCC